MKPIDFRTSAGAFVAAGILFAFFVGCGRQPASSPEQASGEHCQEEQAATTPEVVDEPSAGQAEPSQSPLIGKRLVGAELDLAEVNRWATESGLRNDLVAWVTRALPLAPDVATELSVVFNRVEMPDGATVTVIQDGYLDDSIRGEKFVFEFTRTPCDGCAGGVSPWTLSSFEATQRCRDGRGHADYSAEPCL